MVDIKIEPDVLKQLKEHQKLLKKYGDYNKNYNISETIRDLFRIKQIADYNLKNQR